MLKRSRDSYFDALKFAAILMVVAHHCVSRGIDPNPAAIKNFTVGMNMPLFFLISGYFASSTILTVDFKRFIRHLRGYYWPLAVVSMAFAVLAIPFGLTTVSGAPRYALNRFLCGAWYIWALAGMYALTFASAYLGRALNKWLKVSGSEIVLSLFAYGVHFFVLHLWCAWQVRALYLFFFVGVFFIPRFKLWRNRTVGIVSLLSFLVVVFGEGNVYENGMSFYQMPTDFWSLKATPSAFPLFLARVAVGFAGSLGVMWAMTFLTRFPRVLNFLAQYGTETLGVYILHEWCLDRLVSYNVFPLSIFVWMPFSIIVFLCCHYVVRLSKSTHFCRRWFWGLVEEGRGL